MPEGATTPVPKTLYLLDGEAFQKIYGEEERAAVAELAEVYAPPQTGDSVAKNPDVLAEVEVILSGWGAPAMDDAFLAAAPNLRVVLYGAGSIRRVATPAFWERGVRIASAYAANAVPVSEYALAAILFSLKRGWHFAFSARRKKALPGQGQVPGAYGSTVGLVSLGMVGRLVRERLQPFDLRVVAYDPYVTSEEARVLGVDPMSLEDLFAASEVVSLHAPLLPETEGMILGSHLASMKRNAALINTSRGAVVREAEMIEVLEERPTCGPSSTSRTPNLLSRTPASTTCPTWCPRPTSPARRVASAGAWAALSLMSCADTWRDCPSSTRSPGRERP